MSSHHNPRRSGMNPPRLPTCRKGATFHSPSPSHFTPPSLPRRSKTSLEDVVDEKVQRAALALEAFDIQHSGRPSTSTTVSSYRDEGIPVPEGLLTITIKPETMDRKDRKKTTRRPKVSDSGLGTSIKTESSTAGPRTSTITMSAAPNSHQPYMSRHGREVVDKYIIQQLLAKPEFGDFSPLVRDCTRSMSCLRDVEKTLTLGVEDRAKTAELYLAFCCEAILCVQTALTMGNLSPTDQTRPQDAAYTPRYFIDLVGQLRQVAHQMAASRAKEAKGEKLNDEDAQPSDEIKLHGGLIENGRPAELVRIKNGIPISVATGEPVDMDESKSQPKRLSDSHDQVILRSMARRKKSASALELAPKVCPTCEKQFTRACDLTKHQKLHTRPFKCTADPACKYTTEGWPTEKELDRHVNDKHTENAVKHHCDFQNCHYSSKRESNLKQHKEKTHGWNYIRTKSNGKNSVSKNVVGKRSGGKKRKRNEEEEEEEAAQMSTPQETPLPSPSEPSMDIENSNNNAAAYQSAYGASVYNPSAYSPAYGSSAYSPDGFAASNNEFPNNGAYENSIHSPNGFAASTNEFQNSGAYENAIRSPEQPSPYLSSNFNQMDMDVPPQLHVPHYSNSPESVLRHGSTDSSVPSPFGGNTLSGFQFEAVNGVFPDYPMGNHQLGQDFDLFGDFQTSHRMQTPMYQTQLPEFSPPPCIPNNAPQISPSGHGNHVLYTPSSLGAVDQVFDEYSSHGTDFPLFPSGSSQIDNSQIPLFGEIPAGLLPLSSDVLNTPHWYPAEMDFDEDPQSL